jgi:hypothetical protein
MSLVSDAALRALVLLDERRLLLAARPAAPTLEQLQGHGADAVAAKMEFERKLSAHNQRFDSMLANDAECARFVQQSISQPTSRQRLLSDCALFRDQSKGRMAHRSDLSGQALGGSERQNSTPLEALKRCTLRDLLLCHPREGVLYCHRFSALTITNPTLQTNTCCAASSLILILGECAMVNTLWS